MFDRREMCLLNRKLTVCLPAQQLLALPSVAADAGSHGIADAGGGNAQRSLSIQTLVCR